MRPRIFLSHSKKDQEFIKKLANDLKPARVEVWYDDWEIPPGASLRAKIFEEGIQGCDLFFVYLTESAVHSTWVQQELDAAFVTELETRGGFLALYVDSDKTREGLSLDLRSRRIPVINQQNYSERLLELVALAWDSFAKRDSKNRELVRVFKDREDLLNNTNFGESITGAKSFDMISFSANVIMAFEDHFREIIKNGARVRLALYDPGPRTAVFYSDLAPHIEERPEVKRAEAALIIDKVAFWQSKVSSGKYTGTVELRWLSGTALYYNMWIKDRGDSFSEANLSVYFYGGRHATPVFRANTRAKAFIEHMGKEFDFVWARTIPAPSWGTEIE